MKLSKTSAYAVLAMCHLAARRDQGPVQARQVAEHLGLPLDSTLKILQSLARQQLLRSQLGRGGGYCLDRDPHQVTLLQVIEAIDGPIQADVPIDPARPQIAPPAAILRRVCDDVTVRLCAALQAVTLADFLTTLPPMV